LTLVVGEDSKPVASPPLAQGAAAEEPERLLRRSVSFHEAYHQARELNGWEWPAWGEEVLADLDPQLRERTLDELGV